ncbi:MAG: magnesium transporter, partial [Paraglaciecola sp.]
MAEHLPELIEEIVSAPERGEQDSIAALIAAQDTD